MRRWRFGAVLVLLAGTPPLQAGLYNPAEPEEATLNLKDFARFRQTLESLRFLSFPNVPFEYPLWNRYSVASQASAAGLPKSLTVTQRISLSAYYLRTGKNREAQTVLQPLVGPESKHFLALCNYAVSQQPDRVADAITYANRALKVWPTWAGLTEEQRQLVRQLGWDEERFELCKKAETYHVKLLILRRKEPQKRPVEAEQLDALFGDVRFVGESGQYEPGKLAEAERKKFARGGLAEAIAIVQQLLLWMPSDARLLWQLAELYNADGDRVNAYRAFEACAGLGGFNFRPRELVEHRQSVKKDLDDNPPQEPKGPDLDKGDAPPPEEQEGPLVDWKAALAVGFAGGMMVMLFIIWQFQEIRRRRLRRGGLPPRGQAREISPAPSLPEPHIRAGEPRPKT